MYTDGKIDIIDFILDDAYSFGRININNHKCSNNTYKIEYEKVDILEHNVYFECDCGEFSFTHEMSHDFENGICIKCNAINEADISLLIDDTNVDSSNNIIIDKNSEVKIRVWTEKGIEKIVYVFDDDEEEYIYEGNGDKTAQFIPTIPEKYKDGKEHIISIYGKTIEGIYNIEWKTYNFQYKNTYFNLGIKVNNEIVTDEDIAINLNSESTVMILAEIEETFKIEKLIYAFDNDEEEYIIEGTSSMLEKAIEIPEKYRDGEVHAIMLLIQASDDSYSEWKRVRFKYVKYGDLNDDYKVDNTDVEILKQYLQGEEVEIDTELADVKKDGKIDMNDFYILNYSLNEDIQLPHICESDYHYKYVVFHGENEIQTDYTSYTCGCNDISGTFEVPHVIKEGICINCGYINNKKIEGLDLYIDKNGREQTRKQKINQKDILKIYAEVDLTNVEEISKIVYLFDEEEATTLTYDIGTRKEEILLTIPESCKDGNEHTLKYMVESIDGTKTEWQRFIFTYEELDDTEFFDVLYMEVNEMPVNEEEIVIINELNKVELGANIKLPLKMKKMIYAFDADEEEYEVEYGLNSYCEKIEIPEKYRDGNQHAIVFHAQASDDSYSEWKIVHFKYEEASYGIVIKADEVVGGDEYSITYATTVYDINKGEEIEIRTYNNFKTNFTKGDVIGYSIQSNGDYSFNKATLTGTAGEDFDADTDIISIASYKEISLDKDILVTSDVNVIFVDEDGYMDNTTKSLEDITSNDIIYGVVKVDGGAIEDQPVYSTIIVIEK